MDKVQKPGNSEYYTPPSEPFICYIHTPVYKFSKINILFINYSASVNSEVQKA
jgi:hypothetical protein